MQTVKELHQKGHIYESPTGLILLTEQAEMIRSKIQAYQDQGQQVMTKWIQNNVSDYSLTQQQLNDLINDLKLFLNTLFIRHGVESLNYLDNKSLGEVDTVDNVLRKLQWLSLETKEIGIKYFPLFLTEDDVEIKRFLYELIKIAISYLAVVFDPEFISYMTNRLSGKILYLDSNVIYRLVGLQGEYRSESVKAALDLCVSFGIKPTINVMTLKELKRRISYDSRVLRNYPTPTNLAAVGIKYLSAENFVSAYWYKAKDIKLNVEDFIAYYSHIEDLITNVHNITVEILVPEFPKEFNERVSNIESKLRNFELPDYNTEYEKSDIAFEHDAYCLALVDFLRGNQDNFIEFPAWFLTTDRSLIRFQKKESAFLRIPSVAIIPTHLLGLLGFIQPSSTSFAEAFLSYFSQAFVPGQAIVSNEIVQQILGRISQYQSNPEFAELVLSDQIFLKKLADTPDDSERDEIIHDALIIKAGEIHIALKKTELENDSLKDANQYLDSQIRAERQQKDQLEKERNEKEQELQRYKRENEEAQRQIAATVNSIMIPKQVLGGMALILGLVPLLYQKFWGNWHSLLLYQHVLCFASSIVGLSLAVYLWFGKNAFEKMKAWLAFIAGTIGISLLMSNWK